MLDEQQRQQAISNIRKAISNATTYDMLMDVTTAKPLSIKALDMCRQMILETLALVNEPNETLLESDRSRGRIYVYALLLHSLTAELHFLAAEQDPNSGSQGEFNFYLADAYESNIALHEMLYATNETATG